MSEEQPFVSAYVVDDDILVLKLHGKLDETTAAEFNAEVQKQFDEGKRKMIIDCAHLGSISSFGVGALVTLQLKLRRKGGEVKLAAIQAIVADVLRIVHLDRLLDIYGDIEFARESFYK